MSDRVHSEADELAQECVQRWLKDIGDGARLAQLRERGFSDPSPYIAEAIAAAITGRDPDWDTLSREPEMPELVAD